MLSMIGLAMGAGMDFGGSGMMGSSRSSSRRSSPSISSSNRKAVLTLTAFQRSEDLQKVLQRFSSSVSDWNEGAGKNMSYHQVQGFVLKGTNPANSLKRVRRILVDSGLHPDTLGEDLVDRVRELSRDKTIDNGIAKMGASINIEENV